MTPRLIPWCLAATGFLAALSVFGLHGELGGPARQRQSQSAVGHLRLPPAIDHHEVGSSQAPAASQEPQTVAQTLMLPLAPATEPEPDPNVQAVVVDDEPTVDDLPPPRSPPESAENE